MIIISTRSQFYFTIALSILTSLLLISYYFFHLADPDNGEWSSWTECSQTCGGGIRSRTRNCGLANSVGCLKEEQPCNRDECPTPEPELRGQ